jgi:hypothetical protein
MLGEVANFIPLRHGDLPLIGVLLAKNKTKEGGLPASIPANDAETLARTKAKGDVLKDSLIAVNFR